MRRIALTSVFTFFALLSLAFTPLGALAGALRTETSYNLIVVPASISLNAELGQPIPDQNLQVSADGGSGLPYTISDTANWLAVAPTGGTAATAPPSAHTVSFDPTKFTVETTYNAVITVAATGAANTPVNVPVAVRIGSTIRLNAPLGGESWNQGHIYNIRWTVTNAASGPTRFQIFKAGVLKYTEGASHTGAGDFVVPFRVPYTLTPGTDYKVRIDGSGGHAAISAPLSIKLSPIKIESPNGGETWENTRPAQIRWKINDTAKIGTWLDFYLYRYDPTIVGFPFVKVADFGPNGNDQGEGTLYIDAIPDVGKGGGNQFVILVAKMGQSLANPAALDPDLLDVSDGVFTIVDPPIRVLAPNVDTVRWTVFDPATVQWRANTPLARVGLELWDDNGKVANLIATPDSSPTAENTKTITVPLVPAGQYRVRAFRADNPGANWEDFSDEPLTIINPDVKVISPNGGETLFVNTETTIEWLINIRNTGARATVELWKGDALVEVLREIVCADGFNRLTLLVPNVTPGTDYRIRVAGVYDPDWNDYSNNFFRIDPKPVKVIAPNGAPDEIYFLGGRLPIHWQNVPSQTGTEFYVELYMADYMLFRLPDVYVSTGDQTIDLTLPDWLWPGDYYRVRVISKNKPALFDDSDGLFIITAPPIRLYVPWGGQSFLLGQTFSAQWAINPVLTGGTQIKFQLVRSGAAPIDLKGPGGQTVFYPAYTGGWTDLVIPPTTPPATNYYVRIISNNRPQYFDDSDGPISVKPPAVQVVSPNGGGWFYAGNTMDIHWKTYVPDAGGSVKLQLWRKSGGLEVDFGTDARTTGENTKTVTLPSTLQWRGDYFIRVISNLNPNLYDDSDGVFAIKAVPSPPSDLTASAGASAIYLKWVPTPDDTVSGYNVYRSTTPTGTFTKISPYPVPQPNYTDSSVTRGVRYYYQVRSVSFFNQISNSPSNTVNAVVGQVKLLMQDMHGGVGTEIMVHVYCPNVTGVLGNRLNLVIKYPSIVTPVRLEKTVLTNGFHYSHNATPTNTTGMVTIAGSALPNVPMAGSGRIFDVVFKVNSTARAYQTATFSFGSATRLYVLSGSSQVQLAANITDTAILTVDNRYKMGDIDGNAVVNNSDVTFGFQRLSAGVTPLQLLAGDVDGDGAFSIPDIQLIMLLAQGKSINPVQLPKISMKPTATRAPLAATTYNVALTAQDGANGEIISLPVALNPAVGIAGIQMQVNFDSGVLQLLGLTTTSLTKDFLVSAPYMVSPPNAGAMGFGLVSGTAIASAAGQVVLLNFRVIGEAGASCVVRIADCQLTDAFGSSVANGGNTIDLAGAQGTVHVSATPTQNAVRTKWAMYQ